MILLPESEAERLHQACILFCISTSVYYYNSKPSGESEQIAEKIVELSQMNKRWGLWMMLHYLRHTGLHWNHKRVYRIYTELQLYLRRKFKQRLPARVKEPLLQPLYPNLT